MALDTDVYGMVFPFVSLPVDVFVPVDMSIKEGGGCDIDVSITIKIDVERSLSGAGIELFSDRLMMDLFEVMKERKDTVGQRKLRLPLCDPRIVISCATNLHGKILW